MASHITHVVYGKKIFDRLGGNLPWSEFVVGTIFPDIRYLVHVDREKLHTFETSENKVPLDNSFRSGMYVHSLVDEKREEIVKRKGIYKYVLDEFIDWTALKILEDQYLYDKFDDWRGVISFLDKYYEEEYEIVTYRIAVKKWHNLLKEYFKETPSQESWFKLARGMGFEQKRIDTVAEKMIEITKIPEAMRILKETYEDI